VSDFEFTAEVFEWRGRAPYHFVRVPAEESADIRELSAEVTYGWGMIPVLVRVGGTEWETALWPKDGAYVVPLRDWVRRAEGIELGQPVAVGLEIGGQGPTDRR